MAKIIAKDIYKSKTFWFNLLTIVVAVAGLFGFNGFEPNETTRTALEIMTIVASGNIGLRTVTRQPVKIK